MYSIEPINNGYILTQTFPSIQTSPIMGYAPPIVPVRSVFTSVDELLAYLKKQLDIKKESK